MRCDVSSGPASPVFKTLDALGVRKVVFYPDSKHVTSVDQDGNLVLVDVCTGKVVKTVHDAALMGTHGESSLVSDNAGTRIAVGTWWGDLCVYAGGFSPRIKAMRFGQDHITALAL